MDIATIATATLAILSPYLGDGIKTLTNEAAKSLWDWTKNLFTSKNKQDVVTALEQSHDDADTQATARYTLKTIFKEHPELEKELMGLITEMENAGTISLKTENIEVKDNKFKNNGDVIIGGIKNG